MERRKRESRVGNHEKRELKKPKEERKKETKIKRKEERKEKK